MFIVRFIWLTLASFLISQLCYAQDSPLQIPKTTTFDVFNKNISSREKYITVEQKWYPQQENIEKLLKPQADGQVFLKDFPETHHLIGSNLKKGTTIPIELQRYNIWAPDSVIQVIENGKTTEISPQNLIVYRARKSGIALVINPENGYVSGMLNKKGISMIIEGNLYTGIEFKQKQSADGNNGETHECMTEMAHQPGSPFDDLDKDLKSMTLHKNVAGVIDYETIIAVDTDSEWMAGKGNNTSTAMTYIVSLFNNMNVFYERDLSLRLLIGNVIFRIGSDPFPNVSSISDVLNAFGEYWRVNNNQISRDFALLMSGQNISSNSFSGIAWINLYCENGFQFGNPVNTAGSYSINRTGTNFPAGALAQFVGHELGHNLGSSHTHCYNPPVDECYNAEDGCFNGSVSCPAGGSGTIMSYCHFGAPSGANCGTNDEEFHPTVIGLLDSRIVSNFPSCIQSLGSDIIFEDGFE